MRGLSPETSPLVRRVMQDIATASSICVAQISALSERSRTQVILAIIGLIGIVVPVLIANWSTLFRQGGSQPVAPPNNPGIQTIPDGSKVPLPNPTGYVILFGSYNNLGSAKTDITQAKDKGFGGGIVLFKYGVYRPALVFSTEELANAKLSDA